MPTPVVKSAARVLKILEFFAATRRPATASEIEAALNLPQSSTSVLLRSLRTLGYLEYLPEQRRFRPTMRVSVLGDWLKHGALAGSLTTQADKLQLRTLETVMVGRRSEADIQFIYVVRSHRDVQFYLREGSKRPLAASTSGRALLSEMPSTAARKIVRRNNAEAKRREDRVDEKVVMTLLDKIRESRVSESDAVLGAGKDFHAIAIAVPRKSGNEQFTLSVAGPQRRMLKHRGDIIRALYEYADE